MPYQIENRMVLYSEPKEDMESLQEKLNGSGYKEMGTGIFVPMEDAFLYALKRIEEGSDMEKQEFINWFYSGSWMEEG